MDSVVVRPDSLFATFIELVQWRARQHGDRLAYIFLADGDTQEICLTYNDLDRRARAVGAFLQKVTVKGDRVLLLYPPSLDYITAFFGCLYAGVIAVPAYPPQLARLDRSLPRIQAIKDDAKTVVVLTTEAILSNTEALFKQVPDFRDLRWFTTNTLSDDLAAEWHDPNVTSNNLAFLQYTSGSTGTPKGVMVTHGNLLHNHQILQTAHNLTHQSTFVSWLPLYHDMGLIGNVLQSAYLGSLVVLMSPVAVLQRPFRWLKAIAHYNAYASGGPNFAYDMCVRKVTAEQRATLDLSGWKVAFNGAEPVRHDTLERFAEVFESCGFRREAFSPGYGLAEATLFVTGGMRESVVEYCHVDEVALANNHVITRLYSEEGTKTLVSCGHPWLDQKVVIADQESFKKYEADQVGEVWVSSPSVTQGYWGRVAETARTFHAHLADTGEGPFLRTGDLGFFHKGELYITGRLKDLIIIRGRNIYPQDVELTVEQSHRILRPSGGAAFSVEFDGEERLIVVQEVERHYQPSDLDEVVEAVRQAVGENHEVQPYAVVLIKPATLPKTSSGKMQRHLTRTKYLTGELDVVGEQHG